MRKLAYVSGALGCVSIAFSFWTVLRNPIAMRHVRSLEFPLGPFGEGTIGMLVPILLSTLGLSTGLWTLRHRPGQVAMLLVVCSWLVIWGVLGSRGFQSLF